MRTRSLVRSGLGVALLGLGTLCYQPPPAGAQAVSGTILGVVKDATGAIVPGATVTLVHAGTGFSRTVVSDSQGEYVAPSLPTGTYTVSGELTGFKKVSLSNILLGVDQRVRIDVTLQLGEMSEVVEIQAETPLLQTSSSDLGTTVVEEQIKTLPLNGRNFVSLTRTVPGILRGSPGANIDGAGSLAWRASASFSANGQRTRDNNYMLDGVDNNETWLQTVVIFPSPDALEEFKLQTSTYSAEFGRSLGGVVNLQIKSGTNEYHGSVFEFLRNDAFDANNFFLNRAERPKPDFSQHQFGGTIGGPIIRDRTFFFADYQGLRLTAGQTYLSTVPSLRMRQGDFSELNRVIYDPLTGQPFPGNVIPRDRWDPAAANILTQLYPEPNNDGGVAASGQPVSNYLISPNLEREDNQFDVKVDHRLTESNRAFVRYSYQKTHRLLPATHPHGDRGDTFGAGDGNIKAQSVTFNDTHTFSPNFLNEFRFGWNSIKFFMTPIDYGTNLAEQMGIPGINFDDATSAMTQMQFQNIRGLGANGNQPLITNQNDFQIFDNVTWIRGKHTFKFGGSVTFRSREILNADQIVGNFNFNNNMTSNCAGVAVGCTVNSNTGFDVASFLLGYATTKTRNLFDTQTYTEKRPEYAFYAQDDFRLNQKLTLNIGVRYEVYVPWIEVDDRQSNFDVTTGQFVPASDGAQLGGVTVGRYLQTYSKGDVGPRFGFAYDVFGSGRTIVRGGFGMFWNFTPGGTSSSKAQNPPFQKATALTAAPNPNFSNDPRMLVSAGLPPPPEVDLTPKPGAGTTRSIFDRDFRDAYTLNWNLNVQQQFGRNYMLELAYAGSRGRQYLLKGNPNEAPATVGVTNSNILRPYATIAPALRDVGQVRSDGILNYHAFLAKFQRRFANGFSLLTSYTLAKSMDYNSDNDGAVTVANVYNIAGYNYGPSDYDIRHTLSVAGMYELPWGRDQWYGGWQVSGIGYWRTGYPTTPGQTQGILSTTVGGTNQRPNVVGDWRLDDPTIEKWYEPTAFQPPADTTGTYGDAGRNIIRGPEQFNIDMSIIKYTRLGRFNLELRAEAFNVLNHPQFQLPNRTINAGTAAQITAMLQNPACALCGTTERNIQFAAKLTF